ncbi:MAG: trypsin-like peptidase domain-containing protein [Halieaceae bacterium]
MKQALRTLLSILMLGSGNAALSEDASRVFEKVDPSVVVIMTMEDSPVRQPGGKQAAAGKGLGSGVIIDPEGLVMTAAHVVDTADAIEVMLRDGRKRRARVITSSSTTDLALIQLIDPPEDLPHTPLGDSDKTRTGEQVFVIGTPYGLEHTLTVGYLSGRRIKEDTPFGDIEFLQTDAAINKGNSGGPLLNRKGEVIGIVSHISSQSGGNEGLGFASSSNIARRTLLEAPPVWLGANFIVLRKEMAAALNVGQESGMLIQSVASGSISEKLGIQAGYIPANIGGADLLLGGDIITGINGTPVIGTENGLRQLFRTYRRVQLGDQVTVSIIRRGQTVELSSVVE